MLKNIGNISSLKVENYKVIVLLFVVALAFTASFLITYLSPNNKLTGWQNAETIVPQSLLKIVLFQKHTQNIDASSIQVLQLPSRGGNLYIFDYRSPKLCGNAGCLYSVYNELGNILLEFIANPYLPRNENLIQAINIDNDEFPNLIITQSTEQENIVSRTKYYYEKGKYIRLNKSLTEVGKGMESKD